MAPVPLCAPAAARARDRASARAHAAPDLYGNVDADGHADHSICTYRHCTNDRDGSPTPYAHVNRCRQPYADPRGIGDDHSHNPITVAQSKRLERHNQPSSLLILHANEALAKFRWLESSSQ